MGSEESKFKPGDVLYRNLDLKSTKSKMGHHFGVYIGDGQVIDFSDKGIQKKSYEEFERGYEVYIKSYPETLPRDEIVERAINLWKNEEEWEEYSLVFNNCEHFACFCATGEQRSGQVEKAAIAGAYGVAVAAKVTLDLLKDKDDNDKDSDNDDSDDDVSLLALGAKVALVLLS